VTALDSVDDEEEAPTTPLLTESTPAEFNGDINPSYLFEIYHLAANLYQVNRIRRQRNLNTWKFTPHSGEAGSVHHLAGSFLVADYIGHGVQLQNVMCQSFYSK